ncbi:MAG TPA: ABC transporter permease subunit [Acidimicrobiales bacterium]|nr:ABC transporter permease subunit [Acidimicrobiales bacterium]
MSLKISRLDLNLRRRSLMAYVVGMALYTLVIVALYPQFRHDTSLNNLTKGGSTAAALFGITGSLTSPGGWLNANLWANFFPLVILLMAVGYGAAAIAGQDEDGLLCLLSTLPVRRRSLVFQKAAAMVAQAALLTFAVMLCVLVGKSFQVSIDPWHVVSASVAIFLMGMDFGLIAMAVGSATGKRGATLGAVTCLAAASYLVSSLAPVVTWLKPVRYASLFFWSVGNDQIVSGASPADLVVLVAVCLAALYGVVLFFRKLDLH